MTSEQQERKPFLIHRERENSYAVRDKSVKDGDDGDDEKKDEGDDDETKDLKTTWMMMGTTAPNDTCSQRIGEVNAHYFLPINSDIPIVNFCRSRAKLAIVMILDPLCRDFGSKSPSPGNGMKSHINRQTSYGINNKKGKKRQAIGNSFLFWFLCFLPILVVNLADDWGTFQETK